MVLDKLLSEADVFIQNLAPGAVDRLGFSSSVLKEKYPQLVICGISGYGTFSPYWIKRHTIYSFNVRQVSFPLLVAKRHSHRKQAYRLRILQQVCMRTLVY